MGDHLHHHVKGRRVKETWIGHQVNIPGYAPTFQYLPHDSAKAHHAESELVSHTTKISNFNPHSNRASGGVTAPSNDRPSQLAGQPTISKPMDYAPLLRGYVTNMTFQNQVPLARAAKQNWILSVERDNMLY